MCGIVGFTGLKNDELIRRMNQVQHHRGPDEDGMVYHSDGAVNLAMKRLSILDLQGGHQPMYSADQQYCIVFNGEIFNAPELRKDLEQKGYVFQTKSSDTEVVLLLYMDMGIQCVNQLNGMFAFVIHDRKQHLLFGGRDPFGIKPFHYSLLDNKFSFASELKSLLQLPWIPKQIHTQSVSHYLSFQTIPSPFTIYTSVSKLPAAHAFKYQLDTGKFSTWKYWQPTFGKLSIKDEDLSHEIADQFQLAVNRWMLSDVPVACSLSGGIDSSLVAACATKFAGRIDTFSLGFSDMPWLDERALAKDVSNKYNTKHHEIILSADALVESIPEMVKSLDEPYAGGLPSWFVFKAIREAGFKVALTGSGGDELFGNYAKWTRFTPFANYLQNLRTAWRYKKANLIDILRHPHGTLHYPYFNDATKDHILFQPDYLNKPSNSSGYIEEIWQQCPSGNPIDRVAWVDLQVQLPDEFLFMTDRFSMAHAVEARTPFLDKNFAEFIYSIPPNQRTQKNDLKYLLKNALGQLLPESILTAPKKGFTLPMLDWMRTTLRGEVETLLGEAYLKKQGIFNPNIYHLYTKPFLEGKKFPEWELWTLLNFQFWFRDVHSAQ